MTQHSLDQDFHRMQIHETRKQLSPPIARKPQAPGPTYRAGPAPYRGYHDKDDFPPPPPPPTSTYMDHNFPPPPPESKENIYHEIQDDNFPPPPPAPTEFRPAPEPMRPPTGHYSSAPVAQFESRHESSTLIQPSGRYEREVKQALYSVQSSDSSGRSSPYGGSQYANLNTYSTPLTQTYGTSPMSQTYGYSQSSMQYGQYSGKPRSSSPARYSPTSPRQQEESGVTYAQIAQRSEPSGVTYAQIAPRSDRPVPGPQVPVQIKVSNPGSDSQGYLSPSQLQSSRAPQSPGHQQYMTSPMYSSSQSPRASMEIKGGVSSKEQEVDALTQMLMQGLEGSKDPDFFGICTKCGKKVVGETNGCTAMDQVFHIACFVCVGCGSLLRGKSFYAMERKPYCEPCYVNTLERCSICSKPITDRLLRATGKPYHPACFTCVVCGKSLDGVPFTVDATNQIHCIEDFHKKFAPRCCVCHHPIMPEKGQEETVRVVAMDRSFHVQCYRCEDCNMQLSSEAEGRGCYPLDEHILCKNCNAKRINALTTKLSTEL